MPLRIDRGLRHPSPEADRRRRGESMRATVPSTKTTRISSGEFE